MAKKSKKSAKGRARPSMNVTPLVDVVLVLLIIFMVVLPNTEKGASVQLPTLEHAEEDHPREGEPERHDDGCRDRHPSPQRPHHRAPRSRGRSGRATLSPPRGGRRTRCRAWCG